MCKAATCDTCSTSSLSPPYLPHFRLHSSHIQPHLLIHRTDSLKKGKKTWWGCGQHVPNVMDDVPEAERCSVSFLCLHVPNWLFQGMRTDENSVSPTSRKKASNTRLRRRMLHDSPTLRALRGERMRGRRLRKMGVLGARWEMCLIVWRTCRSTSEVEEL